MIVSWDWLQEYVNLEESSDVVADRLMMSGLNLEGMKTVGDDLAVDLEVTSNRPDCLGHIGVAREAAVLFDTELKIPAAQPAESSQTAESLTSVAIECEDLCPRYSARIIKGVKVGPSPEWLKKRLATLGVESINNIVDATNYVLFECAQPLHAFDFDELYLGKIVVRRAKKGEKIQGIDHKEYNLTEDMCIIADADDPVAIAGVMGGSETEITGNTTNVLIEVAEFSVRSVRRTARALNLHSDSSYRFERGIDAHRMDWASRRCCDLIIELAGGELMEGAVVAGQPAPPEPDPITLRFNQLERILGVSIEAEEAESILNSLGMETVGKRTTESADFLAPTWRRRDVTREADLIEEVARIHGYDKIPEDAIVPLTVSQRTLRDNVIGRVADALTANGFYESITMSFVDEKLVTLFAPRKTETVLSVDHSTRRLENILRQSLVPSLLVARRENERHNNFNVRLFEIAAVFLTPNPGEPNSEPKMISLVTGQSFGEVKGILQSLACRVNPTNKISVKPSTVSQFVDGRGAEVYLNNKFWGWFGELDREFTDPLDLRDACVVAEVELEVLEETADLRPQFEELARFPTVTRDLNFVIDEAVQWADLETVVAASAGEMFESISFSGQYRGKQLPSDKKSYLVTVNYQSTDRTLTNQEVEEAQQVIIKACEEKLGAQLR
jgi:phenylalanyl-tRNA synthetase beta chain